MKMTQMQTTVLKGLGYVNKPYRTSQSQWTAAAEALCSVDVAVRVYKEGALYYDLTPMGREMYLEMKEAKKGGK